MANSVGIAYGIAGAAIAAAVIAVTGSTIGLGAEGAGSSAAVVEAAGLPASGTVDGVPAGVTSSEIVTTASGEQVEYLYVDQPAGRRYDDDDRYEDEEHEGHEEHEEHEGHEGGDD